MLFVNLPLQSDVPLVAPMACCCNCGSTSQLSPLPTDLRRMPAMGLAGTEIKIELPFPYCERCAVTARRRRPTALGVIAVTCLLTIAMGICWLTLGPQLSEEAMTMVVAPAVVLLSLGLVLAFYGLRRKSTGQTSYYQPVRLKNTGHRWPADITGLELGFTNPAYASAFATANQQSVSSGQLKVSAVQGLFQRTAHNKSTSRHPGSRHS